MESAMYLPSRTFGTSGAVQANIFVDDISPIEVNPVNNPRQKTSGVIQVESLGDLFLFRFN